MKFKLDENLGWAEAAILAGDGHDARTVREQGLSGTSDRELIKVCRDERRCLGTLDAELGNLLLFAPEFYHGIVLLRVPGRTDRETREATIHTLVHALSAGLLGQPAAGFQNGALGWPARDRAARASSFVSTSPPAERGWPG